jgi:hypothetical protein
MERVVPQVLRFIETFLPQVPRKTTRGGIERCSSDRGPGLGSALPAASPGAGARRRRKSAPGVGSGGVRGMEALEGERADGAGTRFPSRPARRGEPTAVLLSRRPSAPR